MIIQRKMQTYSPRRQDVITFELLRGLEGLKGIDSSMRNHGGKRSVRSAILDSSDFIIPIDKAHPYLIQKAEMNINLINQNHHPLLSDNSKETWPRPVLFFLMISKI